MLPAALGLGLGGLSSLLGPILGKSAGGGALGTALTGGLGALLPGLLSGLTDPISMTDGGESTGSYADPQNISDLSKLLPQTFYTGSGYIGPAAQLEAQAAKSSLLNVPSAESVSQQARMNSLANQSLSTAQRSSDIARQSAMQNANQTRRQAFDTVRAAGGPIGAISAVSRGVGQSTGGAMADIGAKSAGAYMQGAGQAGQIVGQAEQARNQDLNTRAQIFDRRAMQPAPQAGQILNGIQGQRNERWRQQSSLLEDTYAPLKTLIGTGMGDAFAQLNAQEGLTPTSNSLAALWAALMGSGNTVVQNPNQPNAMQVQDFLNLLTSAQRSGIGLGGGPTN